MADNIVEIFPGVYKIRGKLATKNSVKGSLVYNERTYRKSGKEYRIWDPFRSKLAAAILSGLKSIPITKKSDILYLGASSGTTPSHIADITEGKVYCVEFSKRMMHELLPVCQVRDNMIPILADACKPAEYLHSIGPVDFIYQDVAQKNQADILIKNIEAFNPKNAMITIKARSINSAVNPEKVFKSEINRLKEHYSILQVIKLDSFIKDHIFISVKAR